MNFSTSPSLSLMKSKGVKRVILVINPNCINYDHLTHLGESLDDLGVRSILLVTQDFDAPDVRVIDLDSLPPMDVDKIIEEVRKCRIG